jgi:hypothetical protein
MVEREGFEHVTVVKNIVLGHTSRVRQSQFF